MIKLKNNVIVSLIALSAMVITGCSSNNEKADINPEQNIELTEEEKREERYEKTEEILDTTSDVAAETSDSLKAIGGFLLGEASKTAEDIDRYMTGNENYEAAKDKVKNGLGQAKDYIQNSNVSEPSVPTESSQWTEDAISSLGLNEHKEIIVDGGDTNPNREKNVKVNIGFGDREYWAFTNEHGQVVHVIAEEIIVQDDDSEPVNSSGRYYSNMANVPGTEDSKYDRGHIIADSLGGVANAYNITPQEAYLNRHGDQAYMERVMRDAGGASNLIATIYYPNIETQTPEKYSFDYVIKGTHVTDTFLNEDPR